SRPGSRASWSGTGRTTASERSEHRRAAPGVLSPLPYIGATRRRHAEGRRRLPGDRGDRNEHGLVGGRREEGGADGVAHAARPAHRGGREAGPEGRPGTRHGVPDADAALV